MTESPNDKPQEKKIIVDEDWKGRAQAEKEALERGQREKPPSEEAARGAEEARSGEEAPSAEEPPKDVPLPPPSLEVLANSLGMQALAALGLLRDPSGNEPKVLLHQAKHLVDTIALLEEKTEGNRTAEETAVFSNLLHELRMSYLAVQQQQQAGG